MREVSQFFYRLRGYLADPQSFGLEILISAGLLLAVAGLVIVFALWVGFQFRKRKNKAVERAWEAARPPGADDFGSRNVASEFEASAVAPTERRPWSWRLTIAIVLVFAVLLVLANAVPRYTMGKASYCGYCHTMKKSVRSWRASKHSKVACQACHERPGVIGIVLSQVQGLSNISLSSIYWGRQRPLILKSPVSPACLSCHEAIGKKIVKFRDSVRVSHRELMYSVACETCHPDTGHAGKRLKIKMMDKCVTCHVENQARVACAVCHIPAPSWSKKRLSKYGEVTITYKTCLRCHPTEMRCTQCHKAPVAQDDD